MRCLALAFLITTGCVAFAQDITAPVPTSPLTLEECIRRALAQGFDLEIGKQDLLIAQDNVPIARSLFDPVIGAAAGKGVIKSRAEDGLPSSRSSTLNSSVAANQRLRLGTQLGIAVNSDRFNSDPAVDTLNPAYTSDVTLSIRQPLLKGFGSNITTLPIQRATVGLEIAEYDYEDRALEIIQSTENAYYLLIGATDQLEVFRTSLRLAETLQRESESRRLAGMATRLDVLQAQVGVANARRNVLDAERTLHVSEDNLLALIGRFEFDSSLGLLAVDKDIEPGFRPSADTSYARALEHNPALRSTRAGLDLARMDIEFARDDLKPSLDLDIALGLNGDDTSRRGAFSGLTTPDGSLWQGGLSITYPLGRAAEKARYRQSKYALTREELLAKQLEQDILVSVRRSIRDVDTSRETVSIAALASELALKQHEAETARFRAGLSTGRRVLEAQTDLESARVAELQARLDLQTAIAALRRLEGSSLSKYGVTLNVARM